MNLWRWLGAVSWGALLLSLGMPAGSAQAYTVGTTRGGVPLRWAAAEVTFKVDASFDETLPADQPYAALAMAFDAWRGFPGVPDIRIAEGAPASAGHHKGTSTNGIYRMADWPYEDEKLAVTVVTYDAETGRLLDTDILLNGGVTFAMLDETGPETGDAFDLPAILAHESGHVLGLSESEDDPEATMWPYARPGETHQRTLSEDDEAGVMEAYSGAAPGLSAGCGQASVLGAPGAAASGYWGLLFPALALVAQRRRRVRVLPVLSAVALVVLWGALVWPADPPPGALPAGVASSPPVDEHTPAPSPSRDSATASPTHPSEHAHAQSVDSPLAEDAYSPTTGEQSHDHAWYPGGAPEGSRARLSSLLTRYPDVHVGTATRGQVDQSQPLWFTPYRVLTEGGEEVEVRLPGGTDGRLVQQVGELTLPEDGRELLVAQDARGRAVWTYYKDGVVFGGALGEGRTPLPN